jgi:hypothetical protein
LCIYFFTLNLILYYKGNLGDESETDIESDVDGSVGYDDDVGEGRDVLDRELHTLAKEGNY